MRYYWVLISGNLLYNATSRLFETGRRQIMTRTGVQFQEWCKFLVVYFDVWIEVIASYKASFNRNLKITYNIIYAAL